MYFCPDPLKVEGWGFFSYYILVLVQQPLEKRFYFNVKYFKQDLMVKTKAKFSESCLVAFERVRPSSASVQVSKVLSDTP